MDFAESEKGLGRHLRACRITAVAGAFLVCGGDRRRGCLVLSEVGGRCLWIHCVVIGLLIGGRHVVGARSVGRECLSFFHSNEGERLGDESLSGFCIVEIVVRVDRDRDDVVIPGRYRSNEVSRVVVSIVQEDGVFGPSFFGYLSRWWCSLRITFALLRGLLPGGLFRRHAGSGILARRFPSVDRIRRGRGRRFDRSVEFGRRGRRSSCLDLSRLFSARLPSAGFLRAFGFLAGQRLLRVEATGLEYAAPASRDSALISRARASGTSCDEAAALRLRDAAACLPRTRDSCLRTTRPSSPPRRRACGCKRDPETTDRER